MPQLEDISPLAPPTNGGGFPSLSYILTGAVFLLVIFTLSFMRLRARYLQSRRAMPHNAVAEGNDQELQSVAVTPGIGINDGTHLLPGGVDVGSGMGARVTAHPYTFVDFNGAAAHATTSTSAISRPPPAALIRAGTQHAEPAAPIAHPNTTQHHPPRPHHGRPRRQKPAASLADSGASRPRPTRRQRGGPHGSELTPSLTRPDAPPNRTSAPHPQHRYGQPPAGILAQLNDMAETIEEGVRIAADEED